MMIKFVGIGFEWPGPSDKFQMVRGSMAVPVSRTSLTHYRCLHIPRDLAASISLNHFLWQSYLQLWSPVTPIKFNHSLFSQWALQ